MDYWITDAVFKALQVTETIHTELGSINNTFFVPPHRKQVPSVRRKLHASDY